MDQVGPSSPVLYPVVPPVVQTYPVTSPAATESTFDFPPPKAEDGVVQEPPKKKQKRNKPTLSCEECVERKTKPFTDGRWQCDRGRPHCHACIKRQTECNYAHVANALEESTRTADSRRMTRPPKRKSSVINGVEGSKKGPNHHERCVSRASATSGASTSSATLLSTVHYSQPNASNVFGIGSEHPFANYWTCQGGLPETISVLPEKVQADILLERYFECVDPIYPMLHRQTFYADYEHFWSLPQLERDTTDASLIALIFSMLAMGTHFVTTTSPKERQQTAEFYVSAAHQSLRLKSYLNRASVRSIQAMILITYFLINDNHASDGWAFAGILVRQAYAMGLHRDPNIVCPNASPFDKQTRRKLWQAVLLQDTFLTVLLSLPPSATHTDVNVGDLIDDESSIALHNPSDTPYIRGCWTLANLVQETICSPRSLSLSLCTTPRQKSHLLTLFRSIHRSLSPIFRTWTPTSLRSLAQTSPRTVRQTLFLNSNYFHNIMLIHSSGSDEVPVNIRGALEAAHEAITTFFLMYEFFEVEARVWWVFNHRAFLEAVCMGGILKEEGGNGEGGKEGEERDPLFVRAKEDIVHMLEIMQSMSEGEHGSEVALTRVSVLSTYL